MKNFVQPGDILDLEIPNGKLSGQGVVVGSLFGVATESNETGAAAKRAVVVEGVVEIAKLAADAMSVGDKVNWNNATSEVQLATSTLDGVGTVVEAAGAATTVVKIKLTQV